MHFGVIQFWLGILGHPRDSCRSYLFIFTPQLQSKIIKTIHLQRISSSAAKNLQLSRRILKSDLNFSHECTWILCIAIPNALCSAFIVNFSFLTLSFIKKRRELKVIWFLTKTSFLPVPVTSSASLPRHFVTLPSFFSNNQAKRKWWRLFWCEDSNQLSFLLV